VEIGGKMAGNSIIITHFNMDLDNIFAIMALWVLVPELAGANIKFVSADYEDELEENELAVDIDAGGRGVKGRREADGTTHSATEKVVGAFAEPQEQENLRALVAYIDAQDAYGSTVLHFMPYLKLDNPEHRKIVLYLEDISLVGFYRALKATQAEKADQADMAMITAIAPIFQGFVTAKVFELEPEHEFKDFMDGLLEKFPAEEQGLFQSLRTLINAYDRDDSLGLEGVEIPDEIDQVSLPMIYRAYRAVYGTTNEGREKLKSIFRRFLKGHRKNALALIEAREIFRLRKGVTVLEGGRAVILDNVKNHRMTNVFAENGVRAWVYVDGNRLGAMRRVDEEARLDGERAPIARLLRECGELSEWFFHTKGFIAAFGTTKTAQKARASKVLPWDLALVLDQTLVEHDKAVARAERRTVARA